MNIELTQEEYNIILVWYDVVYGEFLEDSKDIELKNKLIRLYGDKKP